MARTEGNLFVDGFRGKVGGNMVFRKRRSGKVIIAKTPKPIETPPTASQLEIRDKFKEATDYANQVMTDPAQKAMYAKGAKGDQSAYNVALRDATKPPVVKSFTTKNYNGQPGSKISVRAIDDFKVVSVVVSISSADGTLIEEGACQKVGMNWVYTAAAVNPQVVGTSIKAVATDTPGNEGSLEVII